MFDAAGGDQVFESVTALWDWRRQVAALYGDVRAEARSQDAWRLWRRRRDELFAGHPQSPLPDRARRGFDGLSYFDYDPAFRFLARTEPVLAQAPETLDGGPDGRMLLLPFARTRGLSGALGAELTLYWLHGYGGGVFLPFRDATSGATTYGGGRYLLDTIKGADLGSAADGRLVLDFNFAYNPSCSYSDRWICPLAPPANTLPRPVTAGECLAS
jgi:uncharacterized protein (DUF1684 family)